MDASTTNAVLDIVVAELGFPTKDNKRYLRDEHERGKAFLYFMSGDDSSSPLEFEFYSMKYSYKGWTDRNNLPSPVDFKIKRHHGRWYVSSHAYQDPEIEEVLKKVNDLLKPLSLMKE